MAQFLELRLFVDPSSNLPVQIDFSVIFLYQNANFDFVWQQIAIMFVLMPL
jgi:hypothetical protein